MWRMKWARKASRTASVADQEEDVRHFDDLDGETAHTEGPDPDGWTFNLESE